MQVDFKILIAYHINNSKFKMWLVGLTHYTSTTTLSGSPIPLVSQLSVGLVTAVEYHIFE